MFPTDFLNEWNHGVSLGNSTYAGTIAATINGRAVNQGDGQTLTCAIVTLGVNNGSDSPVFGLQESSSSTTAGPWTGITDPNASITLGGSATFGIITGQRQYEYCRVAVQVSSADTIGTFASIHDTRTQMPHGASGSSRSPAGPNTVT